MTQAQATFTKEQFWATLDQLGEDEVRLRLNQQRFGGASSDKRALAKEWIRKRDHTRSAEPTEIARSAKNAAWVAAVAAIVAAVAAIISVIIALNG